jgi:hypothetical protein
MVAKEELRFGLYHDVTFNKQHLALGTAGKIELTVPTP